MLNPFPTRQDSSGTNQGEAPAPPPAPSPVLNGRISCKDHGYTTDIEKGPNLPLLKAARLE